MIRVQTYLGSSMAHPPPPGAIEPAANDKILVFKPQWLARVLSGEKKIEIRGTAYRSGKYYLGTKGMIYAQAHIGHPILCESMKQFRRSQRHHRNFTARSLPYAKTFFLPVLSLHEIRRPYVHTRGAIGIVRYVPR